jgi:RNA polymerase sigma-70 factor (ECF subfamily)
MHPAVEAALVESHREFLGFLVRRLGDRDTAEDVLQQFYLRVVSRGPELRQAESVAAWLYTVLRTTLVDHYRREAARRHRKAGSAVVCTRSSRR